MIQRLCCEKMAITNRDKKYNENNCYVSEENKGSKKTLRNGESVVLMMNTSLDIY